MHAHVHRHLLLRRSSRHCLRATPVSETADTFYPNVLSANKKSSVRDFRVLSFHN